MSDLTENLDEIQTGDDPEPTPTPEPTPPEPIQDSILNTIKQMLGLEADYTAYDTDVLIFINSAFSVLTQLGVGGKHSFSIQDASAVWSEFIEGDTEFNMVKEYIYLSCKTIFDPPSSSFVLTAYKERMKELEWRLNTASEFLPV